MITEPEGKLFSSFTGNKKYSINRILFVIPELHIVH
jgi:hypothetical protein